MRRKEGLTPGYDLGAQILQRHVRRATGLDRIFRSAGGILPDGIIRPACRILRSGLGGFLRLRRRLRQRQRKRQPKDKRNHGGEPRNHSRSLRLQTDHVSAKTDGTARPLPVSQSGSGSPFSRRNSGLNSLD